MRRKQSGPVPARVVVVSLCLLAGALPRGVAQETSPDPAARPAAAPIGRAFPSWQDAVLLTADAEPEPIEPRFAERFTRAPLLVLGARGGEAGMADLAAAREFVPEVLDRGGRRRVGLVVATENADARPDADSRAVHVFVPQIDASYHAPARPWIAVHDRRGILRAVLPLAENDTIHQVLGTSRADWPPNALFGRAMEPVTELSPRDLPADADGEPDLDALRAPAGGLVLYRFWTDGCPHCRASLPALAELAGRYESLRLVPVYHQKGPTEQTSDWLRDYLAELGVAGPWAVDDDWKVLKKLMARGSLSTATSVSFLVDEHGMVRWVHHGPRVHPDAEGAHGTAGSDYAELEGIVARWFGGEVVREGGR